MFIWTERWIDTWPVKEECPTKQIKHVPTKKSHHNNPKFHYIHTDEHGDDFKTLCTDPGIGQKKCQGYNTAGQNGFIEFRKSCKVSRESKTGKQKEKAVLAAMRTKAGIAADTWEEHQKSLGKKPVTETVMPDEVQGLDVDDSDVESEASDDQTKSSVLVAFRVAVNSHCLGLCLH